MAYDKSFYEMYTEYLKEESVRTSHDFIFKEFSKLDRYGLSVLDLGCGLGEFVQYGHRLGGYVGVDKNYLGGKFRLIKEDYHDLDKIKDSLRDSYQPNTFVSLFSIECFHSASEKYAFYNEIFKTFPSIRFGLVGGFFYESKRGQETVGEAGGIVSYQTIEDPSLYISDAFTESRILLKTPSKMFGRDVIEVWKFFIRR